MTIQPKTQILGFIAFSILLLSCFEANAGITEMSSHLTILGAQSENPESIVIWENQPIRLQWTIHEAVLAEGILLILTRLPQYGCRERVLRDEGLAWGGYYPEFEGELSIETQTLPTDRKYYLYGCAWVETPYPRYGGSKTNFITVEYRSAPDLQPSRIIVDREQVHFQVSNTGKGTKPIKAPITYEITIDYFDEGKLPVSMDYRNETAAIATAAEISPGFETELEPVLHLTLRGFPRARVELCINSDRKLPESNYRNNCVSEEFTLQEKSPEEEIPDE